MDFKEIMQEMQNQTRNDAEAFRTDEENPQKIRLVNPDTLQVPEQRSSRMETMWQRVQKVDDYSWARGKKGGLDTGYENMNEALEGGVDTGFVLFAASPNVGKSAFMLALLKQIQERNEEAFCSYMSHDDSLNELMPRYVACDQQITIGQAKNPERFEDDEDVIAWRNEGFKNLYRRADRFEMMDSEDIPSSVEALEKYIEGLRMELGEEARIVIGIDSFYDLTTEQEFRGNDKSMFEYIAKTIKSFTTRYDVTIMATAHLRKLNGDRRPSNDDLKENNRLEYEASLICLLYNEVGIKEEGADVYWIGEDEELKMPVLEMKFSKNKMSSFKGTMFFEMIPAQNYFVEASEESRRRYASLVYQ